MEKTEQDMLVFKDQAGDYYVLPQAALERGRVPAEARAALEAQLPALQAIGAGDEDTQGHADAVAEGAAIVRTVLYGPAGYLIDQALFGGTYLLPVILRETRDYVYGSQR